MSRIRLGLVAVGLAVAVLAAPAQPPGDRPSHVPLPGGITPDQADLFFRTRLRDAQSLGELQKLAADVMADPEKYKLSREQLQTLQSSRPDVNNPAMRSLIEGMLRQPGRQDLDPEQVARWRDFLKTNPASSGNGPSVLPPPRPPDTGPGREGVVSPPQPPPSAQPQRPLPSPPPSRPTDPQTARRMQNLAQKFSGTPIAESPTLRKMVASFDGTRTPTNPDWLRWPGDRLDLERRFAGLGDRLSGVTLPNLDRLSLPETPGGSPPEVGATAPPVPGGEVFTAGLLLLTVAAGVVGLAIALRGRAAAVLGRRRERRRLGPWPVHPEAVRTRDELVLAFDYLSLLVLGQAARHWNHRDIAVGLGADANTRTTAADRLASLYEQARYAPPEEQLPDEDLVAARQDLSFLAGAAAA